ncbi:PLAC8-domain-containing protein [Durotheca rogersii]|uniref:PLAC8-domain-containing protein n=1 Tax=Durotheca rogersii TaxID=419775 RepID=UPI00222126ED|nr:PLAC8-domain-containing protein [Durotheca rogersii]KAI5868193.1 PLAC8-domain-containing protein [Durotheca rogersii]
METQEKFLHEQPQHVPPQPAYYQTMDGQPPVGTPVGTYVQPHPQTQPEQMAREQHPHLGPTAFGQQGGPWQAGLCECTPFTSCLLAWCLPCILLGQTSERIRDPSMQTADLMNSDCMLHGGITCLTGCGWIYAMLKRSEIRERYHIEGGGMGDCCTSYWCPCCALIQQDNEVKLRQRAATAALGQQPYQSQPHMQMPPPAHQP